MTDSFQQADRQFAWNYLGGNKAKNEARSTILDLNKYQQSQSNQIDSAVDGLMGYRLIDILANVLNCEKNPTRQSSPTVSILCSPNMWNR